MKSSQLSKFRREQLGFIFQDFNLLDTLTAYENIALPLTIQRVNPKKIEARIKKLSVQLGIEEVLKNIRIRCPAVSSSASPAPAR